MITMGYFYRVSFFISSIHQKLKINRWIIFVILFYFAVLIYLTWPLIFHLDGLLLSNDYKDTSHPFVDTLRHIEHMQNSRNLIQNQSYPVIVDSSDTAQTYIFFSIFITSAL